MNVPFWFHLAAAELGAEWCEKVGGGHWVMRFRPFLLPLLEMRDLN